MPGAEPILERMFTSRNLLAFVVDRVLFLPLPALKTTDGETIYRRWIDEPVPMLGGRTPREAAAVPKLRAKLLGLVEGIENQAERLALEGTGFETAWLRKTLGLRELPAPQRRAAKRR